MSNQFPSTRWSFILDRPQDVETQRRAADELCRLYWQPVYAFIRRSGAAGKVSPEMAEDLTQGFFASALNGDLFEKADPRKGRLRSYVLGAVKRFVAAEHRKEQAQKRGGEVSFVYIDGTREERTRYSGAVPMDLATDNLPPDQCFDRRWAEGVLEIALQRLRTEHVERGKETVYFALKPLLAADEHDREELQSQARAALRCREGALRVAFHRFRKRYRELVREEVRSTVLEDADIDEEIAWLTRVLVG